jgi:hypothetical protein
MPSSSAPTTKAARGKDAKPNGTSGRAAAATELKNVASPQAGGQVVLKRPTDEEIAHRAYEIYEREGRQPGRELENWLAAEAELSGTKGH